MLVFCFKDKQKKISASTNSTDRVLKRLLTLFFDFASDSFWRRSVRGQLRRRSQSRERSRWVKIKQTEGDLDCWPRLFSRDPGAHRDGRCYSIEATWFLSASANRASFSLLATWCFDFETDMSVFIFFGRFVLAQLTSCFSSTAMPVAVSVNFPGDKKHFFRGRLRHVDDEEATLLSVWQVALGDNELSNYTLRILTPETWRSRRRPVPCLFYIIVENEQAELGPKKLETADSSSLHVDLRG